MMYGTVVDREEAGMRRKVDPAYVTVKELADRLGIHHNTVYYWISQGLITVEREGLSPRSPMRIPRAEADRVVAQLAKSDQ